MKFIVFDIADNNQFKLIEADSKNDALIKYLTYLINDENLYETISSDLDIEIYDINSIPKI